MVLLWLGVMLLAGLVLVFAGPALAQPSPAPGPPSTPTPGVPDPGVRPPGAEPSPSTPAPAPGPAPTPGPPSQGVDDDPAWYDVGGQIRKAVVDLVVWAAEQALQPVMEALGASWLSTPDLTVNEHVKAIWTTSLIVANGIIVLFIVAGGFLVTARETLQTQYGLKQVLPRIAVGVVLANCSLILGQKAIELTNALTVAIAGNTIDGPSAATAIRQVVDNALQGQGFLLALLVIVVIVMCLVLEFTFVLRLAALIILLGVAPAALICHASPLTEGVAHLWWRCFLACLGLQIAQAIVVMASIKVFLTPAGPTVMGVPATGHGLLGVVVCLTMLWLLIKLPGWMRQFVLGPLGQRNGRGLIGQLVHAFLMIKTIGAAAGILGGASTARTAARTAPRPSGPRPLPGGPRPPRPSRLPRPGPTPVPPSPPGPAAFSHAPAVHTPMPAPSGTNAAPTFSHPAASSTAPSPPSAGVPAVQFSHPSPSQSSPPVPAAPPARVAFSHTGTTTPRPARSGAAPAVVFSTASAPQSAPRRPPAPVTPVFSAAQATPTTGTRTGRRGSGSVPPGGTPRGSTPATRPTAARRVTPTPQPASGTPARTPPAASTAARRATATGTPRPHAQSPSVQPSPDDRRSAAPSPPRPSPPRLAWPSAPTSATPVDPSAVRAGRPPSPPPDRRVRPSAPQRRPSTPRGDQP
nr:conjugal transfer protein TrbL family protein [Micromonospora andamanensis]